MIIFALVSGYLTARYGRAHIELARRVAIECGYVLVGSLVLAASAQCSFYLPPSPVPISLQPHAVLALALLWGPRRACSAVSLYLLEGICGAPFFAAGAAGAAHLMGVRGGYLLSYLPVSYLVGYFSKNASARSSAAAIFTGNALILLFGWAWLSMYVGTAHAWQLGVIPFVAGDLLKSSLLTCWSVRRSQS